MFGEFGEFEIVHRSAAASATSATSEAIQALDVLLLELELLCRPDSVHTFSASANEPMPKLLGLAEVAEMLGISRARASQLLRSGGLPAPVARPKMGPIFSERTIAAFAARPCPRCRAPKDQVTRHLTVCRLCSPLVEEAVAAVGDDPPIRQ
ncbi:helix-turn-helix transcriptional regulator [Actinoplanes philippinensis]|uniref:helix-turn-helix transcriptional regulator n=1 Tax=Actinoplanes philippinensis TaxID=35752 RepID=UPI0033DF7586